jgi:hypothetical protein
MKLLSKGREGNRDGQPVANLPRSSRKPSLRLREVEVGVGSSDPANDMEDGPLGVALFGLPFSGPGGVEL